MKCRSLLLRASIYRGRGDLERAERMLAEVEPRLRRSLPPAHIAFGSLAVQRALNAQALGDRQRALAYADQAVAIGEALFQKGRQGRDSLPLFLVRRSGIVLELGRPEKAAADATRALTMLQQAEPPGTLSLSIGRAYWAQGLALQALGKRDEGRAARRNNSKPH